jgi:uncharacterized repeat protein (TIGR01451 family)
LALLVLGAAVMLPAWCHAATAPVISAQPQKAVVTSGSNHTFTVTATGAEPLQYEWFFTPVIATPTTSVGTARDLVLSGVDTNDTGGYHVVVSDVNGSTTSVVARLVVRLPDDPLYSTPQDGWTYIYDGESVSNAGPNALDGTWNHDNGSDSWSGDARGAGVGLLGGLSSTNGVLTVEDAVVTGTSSVDNRRYYFSHNLLQELSAPTADSILNNGITLSFRARLTPPPPADPLTELTNAPNGFVNVLDGKGMFGVRQAGGNGLLISFSLSQGIEDTSTSGTFNFGSAGLHMNNLNGDMRSPQVDPGDGGAVNVLPLDPAIFHEFWITISDNGASPGTHQVSIYVDGSKTATTFDVTAGSGSDAPYTNYIAMGLPSTGQRGAFDVDFIAYKPGIIPPSGLADAVEIVRQPASQLRPAGESATFNVEVVGTAPFSYQWYRGGVPIADATNASYTTAPVTASDHGAQFVVTISNLCGIVTSAPPAVLSFLSPPTIVSDPIDLTVTNGSPASFSVTATNPAPISYQWRFNGIDLSGETNPLLSIATADPAHAGGYDVIASNSAGSTTSRVAVLIVRALDFGDAPTSYPTLRANDGAQHVLVNGMHLGATADFELDGAPDSLAQGDDVANGDDEDGVTFTSPVRAGQPCTVQVVASIQGVLNAWIDFDRNGNWLGVGEQVFTNSALAAGTNELTFTALGTAAPGETFARFRFSTASGLTPHGPAPDGEVEDYRVTLVPVADMAVIISDAPDPVAVGSNLVYTINVLNTGPSPATAVTLTDMLPADTAFVSVSSSAGTCNYASGTVTCNLGNLGAGSGAAVSIIVTPTAAKLLTNSVTVSASELDVQSGNNVSVAITEIEVTPAIVTQPASLVVTQNHTAVFSVAANGTPPLSYQWGFGGTDLLGETAASLTISSAQPAHAGSYAVRVNNRVGGVESAPATLTVLVPPTISQEPASRTNTAGSTATFSVTAAGTAPFSYQWYFNNDEIAGATSAMLTLSNVQKPNAGDYTVVIANSAGRTTSAVAQLTVIEVDFGDAPDGPYPTLFVSNGARHIIQPGVHLGVAIDFEPDGQPSSGASGDDAFGTADEDGIIFRDALLVGQPVRVDVVASTSGVLNAWFDFAGNGTWSDAGDQIFTNTPLVAGTNSLIFQVSPAATSQPTFARFRFSTISGLGFTGEAVDGEVEDYALRVGPAVQMAVSMTASPAITAVGSNVSYHISVTNHGPSAAANVIVSDLLPASLGFVSALPSVGSCTQDGQLITCNFGTVPAAGNATVLITSRAGVEGAITNAVNVSSSEQDLFAGDNTAVVISEAHLYPAITQHPVSQTVTNGDTVVISVVASGTALEYQWFFNGTNLPAGTNATVTIPNVQPVNEGAYVVLVANAVGSVTSAPAQLTVLVPVSITAQPQSLTANAGSQASFTVQVAGTPPFSYQWLHNGTALSDETRATLVISNAQPAHEGAYTVVITNAAGIVESAPATLAVIVAPQIITHPQSATNFAGGTATFAVTVSGTEPLHYQWFFNQTNSLVGANSSLLAIPNVQSSNAGVYHVVVTNAAGTATSEAAQLSIAHADFGDAPAIGYPTLLTFNGAHHVIVAGVHLGSQIDFEGDGLPSASASGDDANNLSDEDGVTFSPWRLGQTASLQLVASTNGFVAAWVDFNQNGTWSEPGEQVLASIAVAAGTNLLSFAVPRGALTGQTFARFRFSTGPGLSVDGPAADGEVEDYSVTIDPAIDLDIRIADNFDPALANSTLTYTITVTNGGPSDASAVVLTNVLPPLTTFTTAVASQGSCTNDGELLTCALGTVAAGQAATVDIAITPLQAGMITNNATVSAAEVDVNNANNLATEVTTIVEATARFGNPSPISVADAATADLYPSTIFVSGVTATVEKVIVTLSNLTHVAPSDLDVLLVGPGGQKVLLMSDAGSRPGVFDVTITFDDRAALSLPDDGFFVTETYRPTNFGAGDTFPAPAPPGPYASQLSAFRGTDPNGTWSLYIVDDTALESGYLAGGWGITFLTFERFADVQVTQTAIPSPVAIGSNLTYVVTVTNRGFADVTGVRLRDVLPLSVTLVSIASTLGACTNNGATIDCVLGDMTNTQSAEITITVIPTVLGMITNEASVTANELDFITANNVSRHEVSVRRVNDLVLFASAVPEPVLIGQQLSYTLLVSNIGPYTATEVLVRHDLPATLGFAGADASQGACSNDGSIVYCALGTLSPGETATLTILANPLQVSEVTAQSSVSAYEIDPNPLNNATVIATTIGDVPTITLAPQSQTVLVLSNVSFTVAATGPGPISYQWLFNGIPLAGETSTELTIASVRPAHAGTYSVIASNRFGFVTAAAPLQIDYTGYRHAAISLVSNSDRWRYNHDGVDLGTAWRDLAFNDAAWNEGQPLFGLETSDPNPYPDVIRTPLPLTTPTEEFILTYYFRTRFNFQNAAQNTAVVLRLVSSNLVDDGAAFYLNGTNIGHLRISPPVSYSTFALDGPANEGQYDVLQWPASRLVEGTNILAVEVHQVSPGSSDVVFGSTLSLLTVPLSDIVVTHTLTPSPVAVGSNLVLVTLVSNAGPATAIDVSLRQSWTGAANFGTAISTHGACTFDGTNVNCTIPSLASGETAQVTVTIIPQQSGSLASVASVRPVELDLDLANNSASANAIVRDPPFIAPAPISQTVTNGDSVVFTATVSGAAPMSLQWLHNGAEIPAATTSSLTISNAQIAEAGDYRLRASNDVGVAVSDATLRVLVRPTISAIADQTIDEDRIAGPLNFTIGDLETPLAELQLIVTSSHPVLVPETNVQFGGGDANRTVTVFPAPNQFGGAFISLTVRDADGITATETFELLVNSVNDVPTISSIADTATPEDTPFSTTITVADVETAVAALVVTVASSNPSLVPDTNVVVTGAEGTRNLTVTPLPNEFGSSMITLTVADGNGGMASASFVLGVDSVNDAPQITGLADRTTDEDVAVTIQFGVSDAESPPETLVLSLVSSDETLLPSGSMTLDGTNATRTLRVVPAPQQSGTATVTWRVEDSGASNNTTVVTFNLTVNAVNDLPTISDIGAQEVNEDNATAPLPLIVGDVETLADALTLTGLSSDPVLIPPANIHFSGTGSNRTVTVMPATNQFGSAIVSITVTDGDGGMSTDSFIVTVLPVNDAPVLVPIADQVTDEDVPMTVVFEARDAEAGALLITFSSSNPGLAPTNNLVLVETETNRLLTITPVANLWGNTTIDVIVTDGEGSSATDSFEFTVLSVNDAPTLDGLTNLTLAEDAPTQTVMLQGITSGASNELQELRVTALSSDPSVLPNPLVSYASPDTGGTLQLRPNPDAYGSAVVTVTVDDGQGSNNIVARTFTVIVESVNDLPSITDIADVVTLEDVATPALTFDVGDLETPLRNLTLTASSSDTNLFPAGTIVFGGTDTNRTVTLHPAAHQFGSAVVTVTVTDADGGAAVDTFTVSVHPENDWPTLDAISNLTTNEDAGIISIPLTGISTGAGNEFETITVTAISDNPALIESVTVFYTNPAPAGVLQLSTVANANGVTEVSVTATENSPSNNVIRRTFAVTINPVNDAPVISDIANQTTTEDTPLPSVPFNVDDIETAASNLVVTAFSSDSALLPQSSFTITGSGANRFLQITPATNRFGVAAVIVTASDGQATTVESFVLTVSPVNDPPSISEIADASTPEDTPLGPIAFTIGDPDTALTNLVLSVSSSNPALVPPTNVVLTGTGSDRGVTVTPLPQQYGSAAISISVRDPEGATATSTFTVTITPVDDAPFISDIPDQSISEDSTRTVSFQVGDDDNAPSALIVVARSSNPALLPDSALSLSGSATDRTLRVAPLSNQFGTATITITVTDTNGGMASDTFLLAVDSVNDTPIIAAISDQFSDEDNALAVPVTVSDIETLANNLTLAVASSNPLLVPPDNITVTGTGPDRLLNIVPARDQFGYADISITVRDTDAGMTATSFRLTIVPSNDVPTISAVADLTVTEDSSVPPIEILISDVETAASNLTLVADSSNPALLPAANIVVSGGGNNRTITLLPVSNQNGRAEVTLTVYDADGGSSTEQFTVFVNSANDPPSISRVLDQVGLQDAQLAIPVAVFDAETPPADLVLSAASSNPALVPSANLSWAGIPENRILQITPAGGTTGSVTITITLQDGDGASVMTSFAVTFVHSVSAARPAIVAHPQSQTVSNGAEVVFNVSASGSAPLYYQWRFNGSNLSGANSSSLTLSDAQPVHSGTYAVLITNIAGSLLSEAATLIVNGPAVTQHVSLVITGAVWKYSDTGTNFGSSWRAIDFDDSLWRSGPAQLGYGDGDEATVVSFGANSNSKHITTYFRHSFYVADPSIYTNLIVRLVRDDGAVVYLNDVEVFRSGMPTGAIAFSTLASSSVENVVVTSNASPFFLRAGTNMVAVEIHQATASDSDISFDLGLTGQTGAIAPGPLDIADQSTAEDIALLVPFAIRFPEATPFVVTANSANQVLVANTNLFLSGNGTNRVLFIVPNTNQFGTALVTLSASNGSVSLSDTFQLTVASRNDRPTVDPINDYGTLQNAPAQAILLTGISSGAPNESQPLTITVSSDNTSVATPTVSYTNGNSTAVLRFTPSSNTGGALVTVTVADNSSSSNTISRSFMIYVRDAVSSTPPVISNIPDRSINEDSATPAMPFTIGDSATSTSSLILRARSSNPALVPTNAIVFGGSGSNRTVTITPVPNQFGAATITVFVIDSDSGIASDSFLLTVNSVNDLPLLSSLSDQTILEDRVLGPVPFTVTDADAHPSAVDVAVMSDNPALVPVSNVWITGYGTNRSLMARPLTNQTGAATITLTALDGAGGSASRSFVLSVNFENDPPVIADIPDQTLRHPAGALQLPFTVSDPDSSADLLTLGASSSNPALVPFGNISFGDSGTNRTISVTPVPNELGSTLITVTVTDNTGLSAADSFTLTVRTESTSPTLNPIPDLLLPQGAPPQTIPLAGIGPSASAENPQLAVSAISSNPTLVPHPAVSYSSPATTGSLLLSPNPGTNGAALITVTVNDGEALFSRTFTVTVDGLPVISPISDQAIAEDSSTAPIAFTVSDAETPASDLVLTVTSSNPALVPPSNIAISGVDSNRLVSVTPIANEFGIATITISATDTNGNSADESFLLVVNSINDTPTLAPLGNMTLEEDAGAQSVPLSEISSGAANENQELLVAVATDNPGLFSALSVQYNTPSTTGVLNFSTTPGASGVATVTVSVNDRQRYNSLISRSFTLTVLYRNTAPSISDIADMTIFEDTPLGPISFSIGDAETGADSLVLSVSSSNPALIETTNIVFSGAGTARALSVWPAANAHGTSVVTVVVTDPRGATASDSFVVTVASSNDAPTISLVTDRTTDESASTGPISFTIGDVETSATNLTVSFTSSNTEVIERFFAFSGSGSNRTVSFTPHPHRNGASTITLRVRDPHGGTATSSFRITVNPVEDPPEIALIADQTMAEDSVLTVGVTVFDWDERPDRLTVTALSSNLALLPNTNISTTWASLRLAPAPDQYGTTFVSVTVVDTSGRSATTGFLLTVAPVNDLPVISAIPNQSITVNSSTAMVPFTVGDCETPSSNLVVTAESSNPSLVNMSGSMLSGTDSNRTVTITPAADQFGLAMITVTVRDTEGGTATSVFDVIVNQTSGPPIIALQPAGQAVVMGADVMLRVVATGPGPLRHQWRRDGVDVPGQTNSILHFPHAQMEDSGEYSVHISNAEGSVLSSAALLRVFVLPVLRITRAGATVTISYRASLGQTHTLEFKDSLPDAAWTPIGPAVPGNGEDVVFSESMSGRATRFYRVRVE